MKVLYFFQELGTPMFQWQRTHIIEELNHHNCSITTFNPLEYSSFEEANERLYEIIRNENWDLFFTNVCYEKVLFPETLQAISKKGVPTLCMRCDNLIIPYSDKVLAPYFDLVWLTSIETKHIYDNWGVKSFFSPYAANPFVYRYVEAPLVKKVAFVGTPYGSRTIMMNHLTENGIEVDLYHGKNKDTKDEKPMGNKRLQLEYKQPSAFTIIVDRLKFSEGRKLLCGSIKNKFINHPDLVDNPTLNRYPSLTFEDMVKTYSAYRLSLASTSTGHTDCLQEPLKVINLRNFEIPMCGGLEICKYNPELANYFKDGEEIVFYKTNDELIDKAKFYLTKASDTAIQKMKFAARHKAETEHTWWNRFIVAFDILGLKYDN